MQFVKQPAGLLYICNQLIELNFCRIVSGSTNSETGAISGFLTTRSLSWTISLQGREGRQTFARLPKTVRRMAKRLRGPQRTRQKKAPNKSVTLISGSRTSILNKQKLFQTAVRAVKRILEKWHRLDNYGKKLDQIVGMLLLWYKRNAETFRTLPKFGRRAEMRKPRPCI